MPAIQKKTTLRECGGSTHGAWNPSASEKSREADEAERREDVAHLVERRDADLAAVALVEALHREERHRERDGHEHPPERRQRLRWIGGDRRDDRGQDHRRDVAQHDETDDLPVVPLRHGAADHGFSRDRLAAAAAARRLSITDMLLTPSPAPKTGPPIGSLLPLRLAGPTMWSCTDIVVPYQRPRAL